MNLQSIISQITGSSGDMASIERLENGWTVRFRDIRKVVRDKGLEDAEEQMAQAAGMTTPFGAAIRAPRPDEYRHYPRAIFCGDWDAVLDALRVADDAVSRTNDAYASGGHVYPERH